MLEEEPNSAQLVSCKWEALNTHNHIIIDIQQLNVLDMGGRWNMGVVNHKYVVAHFVDMSHQ